MPFKIRSARVHHFEAPVDRPVVTAFGRMESRHAVVLAVEDDAGHTGLGESWINFPTWAAYERVVAFERAFLPYLRGREVDDPASFAAAMYRGFAGQAVQAGTVGPLLCALAAVECALYDLAAQRAGVPLNRLLFKNPAAEVRVYASGISAPLPFDLIDECLARGVTLYKLKLGFGDDADRANLAALRKHLPADARIAVDVNRNWTLQQALSWLDALAEADAQWLEEPLRPQEERSLDSLWWRDKVPLAIGENVLMGPDADALAGLPAQILQPDITKYAFLSTAVKLIGEAAKTGRRVIPHFLGSAPGQAASIHLASGCPDVLVEWDINRNPLRTDLCEPPFDIRDGKIRIPQEAGLGWRINAERFGGLK
jgi:L-alanine-DL-glutamate epimerase-like enolase superfamily enzyme